MQLGNNMVGDRFNYYLKLIMNSPLAELGYLSEQFENDTSISEAEAQELERLVEKHLLMGNREKVRIMNSRTGIEEFPRRYYIDDFGNSSTFLGTEQYFGISWMVYAPKPNFISSPTRKWYYNEKISNILSEILVDVVPGKFKDYFHYPPWILGTVYAPGTVFMATNEIITLAVARSVIPDWDFLVSKGIPKQLVELIRTENTGPPH